MHLNGDFLSNVTDLLSQYICPNMPWDIEDCKVGVYTWWPRISEKIIYTGQAPYICGPDFVGDCPQPLSK